MKVSKLLADEINRELGIAVGFIDIEQSKRARKVLLKLSELINGQTVAIVENCESCGFRRSVLDKKP